MYGRKARTEQGGKEGRMKGRKDGWMDGWLDGQTDGRNVRDVKIIHGGGVDAEGGAGLAVAVVFVGAAGVVRTHVPEIRRHRELKTHARHQRDGGRDGRLHVHEHFP
jgi:hypothetical protein